MIRLTRVVLGLFAAGCAVIGGTAMLSAVPTVAAALPIVLRGAAVPIVIDLLLVPLAIVIGLAMRRRLSGRWFRVVAGASVLSILLTVIAIPFLVGIGRRRDNPTLLDRNYWAGWIAVLAVTWVVCVLGGLARGRRRNPSEALPADVQDRDLR